VGRGDRYRCGAALSALPEQAWPDAPVLFRGEQYRGAKGFWRGTQRSVPPAETLERIRPTFATAGLTRIANITGLDRVGIPVTIAVRPNSRTLAVSSGKGFTLEAARVSGAMEGLELFHAEEAELEEFLCSYAELPAPRLHLDDFPITKYSLFNPEQRVRWTSGWDLMSQQEVAVPCSMIQMNGTYRSGDLSMFQLSSNGLASGNNLLEAINHALFEAIERDAVACARAAAQVSGGRLPVVDPATIEHPLVLELLDRLAVAEIRAVIFDCTLDTDVPTYMAYLCDRALPKARIAGGFGAHLDPEIAMVRALTEAVQGRTVYIAGSRDDAFRHNYLLPRDNQSAAAAFLRQEPSVDARCRRSEATATFEGDTNLALAKLRAAGIERAVVVDLSRPDFPIRVVKVIVPGLEGYMFDSYRPGRRAQAYLAGSRS
jgi:ribosomal protein S12 methylthiotransferase accessory factor